MFLSTLTYFFILFGNLSVFLHVSLSVWLIVCATEKGDREEGVDEGKIEKDARVRRT